MPVWWYIIGISAIAGLDFNVRLLGNWIFAQATGFLHRQKLQLYIVDAAKKTEVVGLNV